MEAADGIVRKKPFVKGITQHIASAREWQLAVAAGKIVKISPAPELAAAGAAHVVFRAG